MYDRAVEPYRTCGPNLNSQPYDFWNSRSDDEHLDMDLIIFFSITILKL